MSNVTLALNFLEKLYYKKINKQRSNSIKQRKIKNFIKIKQKSNLDSMKYSIIYNEINIL